MEVVSLGNLSRETYPKKTEKSCPKTETCHHTHLCIHTLIYSKKIALELNTPLKIKMEHNSGGLEDDLPFTTGEFSDHLSKSDPRQIYQVSVPFQHPPNT